MAEESPEWNDMTPEQRAKSARAMECFAGMVECIDVNVGKVMLPPFESDILPPLTLVRFRSWTTWSRSAS